MRTARLEAFSDGVFAIAITLLVLEISVPSGSGDDLWHAVLHEWPAYLAYLISFSTVGAVWLAHTAITHHLRSATPEFVRLNLLLLLVVAFVPFPTKLLGEYAEDIDAERVATTLYGITLLFMATIVSLLWRYAVRERLVHPDLADEEVQTLTRRLTPGLLGYLAMIVLGLFVPRAALAGYLAIAVVLLVPFGAIRHRE